MLASSPAATAAPGRKVGNWRRCIEDTASRESFRQACMQATLDQHWLNGQHLELCKVPAPTFREGKRAKHLRAKFAGLGLKPRIDAAGNVVVPLVHAQRLPFLAVTAHMDTTLAPASPEEIRVDSNGTMRGPGVTDNGTGLAALLALGKYLATPLADRPARNILLVANVAEEGEGNLHGMRYLAQHSPFASRIDRYLVVDGASIGHITAAALGSKRFELVVRGRGGHSWNDFGRANPVNAVARAIVLMGQAALPSKPRTTLSVGMVHGGTGVNSIPAVARAKIDVRSSEEAEILAAAKIVERSAYIAVMTENKRSSDRLTGFELREIGSRPAASGLERNPVADCFRAVDSYLRIPSALDCASTDANVPLAAGVPTVAIGSGGRGGDAHAPSEWYNPRGRDLGLHRLLLGIACLQARP